jgi:hypothetical protein
LKQKFNYCIEKCLEIYEEGVRNGNIKIDEAAMLGVKEEIEVGERCFRVILGGD